MLVRLVLFGIAAGLALAVQLALDASIGPFMFMTLFTVVLMSAVIFFRAERRLPLLCDPFVIALVFLAQFYVIGAPSIFLLDYFVSVHVSPERGVLILALFCLLVTAFFVGYQIGLGQAIADSLPDFERSRRRMPWAWFETAVILAGALGCVALVMDQGGVGTMIRSGYGTGKEKPIYVLAYHALLAGTFLMAWRVTSREKSRPATVAPLVGLVCFELLFWGVIAGSRKYLFFLFFGLVCIRTLRHGTRNVPKVRIAAALAVLLVFFSVWGQIRSRPLAEIINGQHAAANTAIRDPFYMGYFKGLGEPFEIASLVIDVYPAQHPYEYGKTLLVTLLAFIPRAAWPDKPVGLAKSLTRYTDGVYFQATTGHSITPTLLGDFYANFGVVGVILGGIIFGVVCRTFAAYCSNGMTAGIQLSAARVLIPSAFVSALVEVRSDTSQLLAFYVMVIVPIIIACAFTRLETESGQEALPIH
jgi:oligosaccharide repeat unit polymerase